MRGCVPYRVTMVQREVGEHSALLAGVCTIAVETPLFFFVQHPPGLAVGLRLVVGVAVFGLAFHLLRRAFQRRTGGIGFRA